MGEFPHLKFAGKVDGEAKIPGGGSSHSRSQENKRNRSRHAGGLLSSTSTLKADWQDLYDTRDEQGLAQLDKDVVPVFLQINPDILLPYDNLEALGIEIISEEEDGLIIGASLDNLKTLEGKIQDFTQEQHGSGKIADLWTITSGNREDWKPEHILSDSLFERWGQIQDDTTYDIEVSIAFDRPIGTPPDPKKTRWPKTIGCLSSISH